MGPTPFRHIGQGHAAAIVGTHRIGRILLGVLARTNCASRKFGAAHGSKVACSGSPSFVAVVRRRRVALRRIPFRAGESLVAPVRPSPTKDAFSIGDSSRNRK